jgi:hypothetical protein
VLSSCAVICCHSYRDFLDKNSGMRSYDSTAIA